MKEKNSVKIRKTGILVLAVLLIGIMACGCGVNRKSPEGVVKSLVEAYEKGKEKDALTCYGQEEEADAVTKEEVEASIAYFKAHEAEKVEIQKCEVIQEMDGNSYVYITYQFVLGDDKNYPALATYLVGQKDKKYYVLPPAEVDETMEENVQKAYEEFMNSEAYKDYTKLYDAFMTKHPGYEEKIADKLKK